MSALSIGLSGLEVNQQLLNLTGQNITNADTPNYHNQVANLSEDISGGTVGTGVSVADITRDTDQAVQQAVTTNTSASSDASTQLDGLNQLQNFLITGSGTLHDNLENLFNQLTTLTAAPDDPTQRQVVVSAASAVTSQLNDTEANLQQMSASLVPQAQTYVNSINTLTSQIAQLNQQIQQATLSGANTNGYQDQRDQAIASLAQLVNVQTVAQPYGQINVLTGGAALVLNNQAVTLSANTDSSGNLTVTAAGSAQPLNIAGGQLGGTLSLFNTTVPAVQSQLNTFTSGLATQFDQIQATGLGLSGSMTSLISQRPVVSTTAPLADTNQAFPPQAGDLYITVTNQATGQSTLNQVQVDPSTQSLADIATAISAVPNLNAVVDSQSGTLSIIAAPGYAFNFTGNLSTSPDSQTITGTTVPTIDGQYTGASNGLLQYTFVGSGTIGATPNLTLQVTDSTGAVLGSLNVGQGYTPGTDIAGPDGVNVNLTAGTANSGDSFSVNVAATPDSANLLPALGLNSFFVGTSAADLQVNPALLNNANLLATSTSGQAGDGSNLTKMVNLQNQPVLANNTQSLQTYLENIIGNVGTQANEMQTSSTAYTNLGQQLSTQLQNATGVDTNQALAQLVQYQQAYQMSAQFVSVANQIYQDLYNILQTPVA